METLLFVTHVSYKPPPNILNNFVSATKLLDSFLPGFVVDKVLTETIPKMKTSERPVFRSPDLY